MTEYLGPDEWRSGEWIYRAIRCPECNEIFTGNPRCKIKPNDLDPYKRNGYNGRWGDYIQGPPMLVGQCGHAWPFDGTMWFNEAWSCPGVQVRRVQKDREEKTTEMETQEQTTPDLMTLSEIVAIAEPGDEFTSLGRDARGCKGFVILESDAMVHISNRGLTFCPNKNDLQRSDWYFTKTAPRCPHCGKRLDP